MSMVSHRFAWIGAKLLVLALALSCGNEAPAEIYSRRQLAAILARSPAPEIVTQGRELEAAEKAVAGIKNATAFLGVGDSMQPLYASNTAVVVEPIACNRIKMGMTVVYVNHEGFRVAHTVVGASGRGFLVQGVNNDKADADVVNQQNLVGVIVAAFASAETSYRRGLAHQLLQKSRRPGKGPSA